jgi:glycosyltransferase involved in cell wall biosynthesis
VRIVVVMPLGRQLGGGELMLTQLLRQPHAPDVAFTVIFLRDGPMVAEARAQGHDVRVVEAGRFRELRRRWAAVQRIVAIAREVHADVLLAWMVAAQPMVGVASLLSGIPAVWYQVGLPSGDLLDRVATVLPARGVIVLSHAGAAAQRALRPRRPQRLVYPGVSIEQYDSSKLASAGELRVELGLPPHGPLIGIVGRLQRWKGMHVVIDAMPDVLAEHPDAHLVLVGGAHETEPEYPRALAAQIEQLGMGAHVTVAGFQREIPRWMQAMDVVVHASDREPFGIVVIEAMALGKPVVAGAAGGPAEVITDGVDGLLAPYGDSAALARAVTRFLDDPVLAASCGANAVARAQDFEESRYAHAVVQAVRELVSASR